MENNTKKYICSLLAAVYCLDTAQAQAESTYCISSPDGAVTARLEATPEWTLSVQRGGCEVLPPSPLGITLKQGGKFPGALKVLGTRQAEVEETYAMPVGKRSQCHNHAKEWMVDFGEGGQVKFSLIVRAYNEGVAYRYRMHGTGEDSVLAEATAFRIPKDAKTWGGKYFPHYQYVYDGQKSLKELSQHYHQQFPLLYQTPGGCWGYLTEAAVDGSYCGARLRVTDAAAGMVKLDMEGKPEGKLPWSTPWRVVFAVNELKQLVESTLVNDLAPPCALADTDWIKPGTAIFPWLSGLVTGRHHFNQGNFERLKKFVDVAAEEQWPWIEFDSGMEGWPAIGDRPAKDCQWMKELVDYATGKGVAVYGWEILKYFSTSKERSTYYDFLLEKGFRGVKVDFLDSDSQARYQYREDVARECAARKLLVSYHGDVLPRGMQRTWPNIVTQEGVAGEEHYYFHAALGPLTPAHNVNLVFTRNVPGSMDYTPMCIEWDGRGFRKTSAAHEMALPVVYESGWTSMGLSPESIRQPAGKTAAEFLKGVPAAWDDIRFLAGAPDEYAVVARRKGADWWIGGINAGSARKLSLSLDFLKPGSFETRLYHDDPATVGKPPVETRIAVTSVTVGAGKPLVVDLPANGGFGVTIRGGAR